MKMPEGFGDLAGMMKQAQEQLGSFQEKMKSLEDELEDRVVEGSSGGGMVKVLVNGQQEPLDIDIEPELLEEEDPEFIQEMVLAAMRQAIQKSKDMAEEEKNKLAGDLGVPGLENLL